jgi:hypothetical protein
MNRALLSLFALIALAGCKLDPDAAVTDYSFGSYKTLICDDAKFQESQYNEFFLNLPEEKRRSIEERLSTISRNCSSLAKVYKEVELSYKMLKHGVYWPREVYVFNLKLSDKDSRTVGLFKSQSACESASSLLSEVGYTVSLCGARRIFWKYIWL